MRFDILTSTDNSVPFYKTKKNVGAEAPKHVQLPVMIRRLHEE